MMSPNWNQENSHVNRVRYGSFEFPLSLCYSAEMTKAEAQMRRLARAGQEFGHSTVSQMQASSAAIRVVEGNLTSNIRAAERFIPPSRALGPHSRQRSPSSAP